MIADEFEKIWEWYEAACDSLRLTQRVVKKKPDLINDKFQAFAEKSEKEIKSIIDNSRVGIDNLVVLHIVATLERVLRKRVVKLLQQSDMKGDDLRNNLREVCKEESEYGNYAGRLLELFPVDGNLKGQVKQLIQFRDWVAHGNHLNESEPEPPSNCTPKFAFETVKKFLVDANIT